jgi:hypothetical protein
MTSRASAIGRYIFHHAMADAARRWPDASPDELRHAAEIARDLFVVHLAEMRVAAQQAEARARNPGLVGDA